MDISFEEINTGSIAEYRKVRLRGLQEHPEAFGESAEQFAERSDEDLLSKIEISKKNSGFILGAFFRESMIGTVAFSRQSGLKTSHRGSLWGMYVLPEYRSKAVGSSLIKQLLTRVQQISGLQQIHLAVTVGNDGAKKLYEKFNFKIYGTDPKVLRVNSLYYDEYLMVLDLTAG